MTMFPAHRRLRYGFQRRPSRKCRTRLTPPSSDLVESCLERRKPDYLAPVMDENWRFPLVGDGLSSCIMGFDHNDKQRSHHPAGHRQRGVMATAFTTWSEAIEFAKQE